MDVTRSSTRSDLGAFLTGGRRSRAVVIIGEAGIGVSHLVDQLHLDLLAAGAMVLVVDDVHAIDDATLLHVAGRLAAEPALRVVAGGHAANPALEAILRRHAEVRVTQLGALTSLEVRGLVAELGVPAWSHHARMVIEQAAGNPRRVLDIALDAPDYAAVEDDPSLTGVGWTVAAARRLDASYRDDAVAMSDLLEACERAGDAASLAVLADAALLRDDLDRTIDLATRAASASDDVVLSSWANALAAAARVFRGEATAFLELRRIAGSAERRGDLLCAAAVHLLIAQSSCITADMASSRRAAVRSIELAEHVGATAMAAGARIVLVDALVATGEAGEASALAHDLERLAAARGWYTVEHAALVSRIRSELALGRAQDAAQLADRALEQDLEHPGSRMGSIEVAVLSARAHAAHGSVGVALAVIDRVAASGIAIDDASDIDFWLGLEAVRVLGAAPAVDPAELTRRIAAFTDRWPQAGHGGALEAAHAEVSAWKAFAAGAPVDAGRRVARARELWVAAECHDELPVTERIVEAADVASLQQQATAVVEPLEDPAAFDALTRREREIARYVAGGMTNPEIAAELHLSARTVEHHVGSILRKLELTSRRALVRGHV